MLHWIKETNIPTRYRVTEIVRLSEPHQWRYCPTQDNSVDMLTRGITSTQLKLWKYGPQWFPSENSWPTWSFSPTIEIQALTVTTTSFNPSTTEYYSGTIHINSIVDISSFSTLSRCATSHAVHLEVVTDLTVETFLLAFRRFTGRRSLPQIVVSLIWQGMIKLLCPYCAFHTKKTKCTVGMQQFN